MICPYHTQIDDTPKLMIPIVYNTQINDTNIGNIDIHPYYKYHL